MHPDLPPPDGPLVEWIAQHWAPQPGDPASFLEGLAARRRRRIRNDLLGGLALAAAVLLFVAATPAVPDQGWLAPTSLAQPSGLSLPAELLVVQQSFVRTTP